MEETQISILKASSVGMGNVILFSSDVTKSFDANRVILGLNEIQDQWEVTLLSRYFNLFHFSNTDARCQIPVTDVPAI